MLVKIITSCVVSALALGAAAATAQDMERGMVVRVYNDTVAPADQVAYEAGVKAYNKCLADHKFKYTWTALGHETGNTYMYSFVSEPVTWADFDKMHETGKACDDAWRGKANPHLKSEYSTFLVAMPEMSHTSPDMSANRSLVNITFFTLKHGHDAYVAFTGAAKKLAQAADKAQWPYHYLFQAVRGGDRGSADFVLASWSKNWADYGAPADPPFWKMVEGVYGADETANLRKTVNDTTEDISSHVDVFNADLTYTAPK
jgi:hypothetical protein